MSKVYQLVMFESDDERAGTRTCNLLKKLGIGYYTEDSVREQLSRSPLLSRRYIVKVWVATSDIPKLEEALTNETPPPT